MIHVVTATNRALYAEQIEEMHRQRWQFYVEQRGWKSLKAKQATPGIERDEYDDEHAVYLMSLSEGGAVQGAMRLRPTDHGSLLMDHFPGLVAAETGFAPSADTWEITRLMRAPSFRGAEGALRLRINCAACEFAIARDIRHYVAVADTFLLPAARALNRHKHRLLGLPRDYEEGEMVAMMLDPDAELPSMFHAVAGFDAPQMIELPMLAPGSVISPMEHPTLQAMRAEATRHTRAVA